MNPSILDLAASHAGIATKEAQLAVVSALRSLHRAALTREEGVTASLLEARFNFGAEAAYHLAGIFEHQRVHSDHELPWFETMDRMAPESRVYRALIDRWLAGDGDPEPDK